MPDTLHIPGKDMATMVPSPRHVLLLEDDLNDALLITRAVHAVYPDAAVEHASSREELLERLDSTPVDIVLSDSTVPGCEGLKGFHLSRDRHPHVPFVYVSGASDPNRDLPALQALGAAAFLTKDNLAAIGPAIQSALVERDRVRRSLGLMAGYESLTGVVGELATAHDLSAIMRIVMRAAQEISGADGCAFVMRDGESCLYADEDGIDPLWLGRRIPLARCLGGWAITHRQPAVAADIQADARASAADYEGTFVRAAVIVPVRAVDPIGAIGVYWSEPREPYAQEVRLLQALADATAVAMDNARMYQALESRVREHASEVEAFTLAVSHGLQAPMRHLKAFAGLLREDQRGPIDPQLTRTLDGMIRTTERMEEMLSGLVALSRTSRFTVSRAPIDIAALARPLAEECQHTVNSRATFVCPRVLPAVGDPVLVRQILQNLIENAFKFSSGRTVPVIELGAVDQAPPVYFVRDNGVGFDDTAAENLFEIFHRLAAGDDFPGTGVGLAIAQRVVHKHGGRIWAHSQPDAGATFYFTLEPVAPAAGA
jgi:hypothetical protein